jgi:type I restriction enzyme, S subunit
MPKTRNQIKDFKNTPIGEFPSDWGIVSIDKIAVHVGSGLTPRGGSNVYKEEGILFIRSQNVTFNRLILNDVAHIDERTHESMSRSEIFAHDVLLNITGASIGRCCPMPEGLGIANVNQHVCAIRLPNPCREDAIFLSSVLSSPIGQSQIDKLNAGGNREGLNYEQLRGFLIPFPQPSERAEIANVLTTIDSTIAHTSTLIAKLKQMKAGLLHDLLTRGLDENGELRDAIEHPEQFKNSPLGRIPKDWNFGQLADFYAIPARNGLYKPSGHYGRGALMIHMPQMFRGLTVDASDAARVEVSAAELERYRLQEEDLVFARRSLNLEGAGRCSLIPSLNEPVTFESSIIRVRLQEEKLRPIFANYFLNSEFGFRLRLPFIRQVAVSGVSSEDVASIPVPCPPVQEQDQIIERIIANNSRIGAEESYLNKLKEQKKGLMHDLLTGRVRVTDLQEIPA